jgi:hypothetical protein
VSPSAARRHLTMHLHTYRYNVPQRTSNMSLSNVPPSMSAPKPVPTMNTPTYPHNAEHLSPLPHSRMAPSPWTKATPVNSHPHPWPWWPPGALCPVDLPVLDVSWQHSCTSPGPPGWLRTSGLTPWARLAALLRQWPVMSTAGLSLIGLPFFGWGMSVLFCFLAL